MAQLQLAAINPDDISPILDIEKDSFSWPWNRISFVGELACKQAYNFTVKCLNGTDDQQVIGYIFCRLVENELHILRIAIEPNWRSRGIASWLLKRCVGLACEKGATAAFLEVRPSNQNAISLYRKQGFRVIGKRPNYYTDTREDALVLLKNLKEDL
jgi:ribosomal-protein-alanine N-acetyltransferase